MQLAGDVPPPQHQQPQGNVNQPSDAPPQWLIDMDAGEAAIIRQKVVTLTRRYRQMHPQMIADLQESHNVTEMQLLELAHWALAIDHRVQNQQQKNFEEQRQQQQQFEQQQQQQQQQQQFGQQQQFDHHQQQQQQQHMYQQQMQYQQQQHVQPNYGGPMQEDPGAAISSAVPMNQGANFGMYPVNQGHMQQPVYGAGDASGARLFNPYEAAHPQYGMQQHAVLNTGALANDPYHQAGGAVHAPTSSAAASYGDIQTGISSNHWANMSEEISETDQAGIRKGKWTIEEEEYTRRLVQHFNNGLLMIPDDTTLRAFLSNRLKCDRMRITKKFRGICFGRKYKSCEPTQVSMVAVQRAAEELKNLEARFLTRDEQEQDKKAAIQEEIDSCLQGNGPISRSEKVAQTYSEGLGTSGSSSSSSSVGGGGGAESQRAGEASGAGHEGMSEEGRIGLAASQLASDELPHDNHANIVMHHEKDAQGDTTGDAAGNTLASADAAREDSEGGSEGPINSLQARRVANLLDRPSEALLLVLGQKYLAQLKKQARALHEAQRDISSLNGNSVDMSPAAGENGEDEDATAMLVSSSAVLPSSAASQDEDADGVPSSPTSSSTAGDSSSNGDDELSAASKRAFSDTLTVDAESASQSFEPGKRVKVMACSESDSDAGKLLLGFFNTVNKKKAMRKAAEDGLKENAVKKLSELPLNGNGRQVLVADDSKTTRNFLKKQLERNGYIVETAEHGQMALDSMKVKTYDIVFLDLEMPIMNGFSCSAAFREWERNTNREKRQPICVLSMHTGQKEKEMCAEVGADFFEAKPAKIPGLIKIAELCVKLQN